LGLWATVGRPPRGRIRRGKNMNALQIKPERQQTVDKKPGDPAPVMVEERLERGSD